MKEAKRVAEQPKRALTGLLCALCALAVMAAAFLVRTGPAAMAGSSEEVREAFTDDDGVPYLTDMDSYYHVRLVEQYLENGRLGDVVLEDGRAWDLHSFYPAGRSADYEPGIVWLTAGVWRAFGGSLAALEYRLAAIVSVLAALVAFLIGWRAGGLFGGLTAGLLVGCAPQFALRTCYGRFDTDMFVVLMECLLILFLTESLRARPVWKKIAFSVAFALASVAYGRCWMPKYSLLFVGLTLGGGLLYVLLSPLWERDGQESGARAYFARPALWTLVGCGILTLAGAVAFFGVSVISRVFSALGFSTEVSSGVGVLPNLFSSISELSSARFFPYSVTQLFLGYVPGQSPTVVNGVGGLLAMALAFAGLVRLALPCFSRFEPAFPAPEKRVSGVYLCVLGVWLVGGFVLVGYGVRFLEHLAIPVGLLAGCFVGTLFENGRYKAKQDERPHRARRALAYRAVGCALLCAAVVSPSVVGAAQATSAVLPSVSDASAKAMQFVRQDARETDAVLASWWDMGYYYEALADHPCLWDGGIQNGARSVLVAKALVTEDLELARRIWLMLSTSGNAGIDYLMEFTDARTAYETLWEALPLEKEAAMAVLAARCGMNADEAAQAEAYLHPAVTKETYLVLTYTMTQQIGWYEYFANWDFSGQQPLPSSTLYSYTPEGTPLFDTQEGQTYLADVRGQGALWELFFNAKQTPCFTPAFEWHDGLEHVRIWRVEP